MSNLGQNSSFYFQYISRSVYHFFLIFCLEIDKNISYTMTKVSYFWKFLFAGSWDQKVKVYVTKLTQEPFIRFFWFFYMGLEGHECRKVKKPYFFGRFLFPWKQGQKVKFDHLKDIAIFYYFRMRYLYRDSTGNPYLVHFWINLWK